MIFEGEYLNGIRNGKGKEYHNYGKIKFEGEYLNGKRNGKGKKYDYKGNLIFEGEYLDGNRLIGKEYEKNGKNFKIINNKKELHNKYNENNTLKLENNYINWLIHGKGIEYYFNGIIKFEGEYLISKKLKEKDNDEYENILGDKFEGQFSHGKIEGRIDESYYKNKILIEDYYLNAKKNGKGKCYDEDGNLEFEGEYLYNHKRKGKEYYKNGKLRFEGEYLYDKKWSGKGYDKDGNKIYELINGNGPVKEYQQGYVFPSFEGEYLNGKRNGKGKEYKYSNFIAQDEEYLPEEEREKRREYIGTYLIYDGEYLNGKWNGKGKEYYINGSLKYDGEYLNGKKHGKGKFYDKFGKLIYEGIFENDDACKK